MKTEIKKRLKSEEWSAKISTQVLAQKKKSRIKIILSTSFSSLALAALIVIALVFNLNQSSFPKLKAQFISDQIKGTYQAAGFNPEESNEIDTMIEEILSKR